VNGYNFTERVRKVLAKAREAAARLHHEYVGTEHLLLGLVGESEGVAVAVLTNLGANTGEIQRHIEETVKMGTAKSTSGPDLPYSSRAKKVLELAMSEAREMHHNYVGSEHLLLGLIREEKGIAAQVLADVGVNLEAARAETLRLLGAVPQRWPIAGAEAGTASADPNPDAASARAQFHAARAERFRQLGLAISERYSIAGHEESPYAKHSRIARVVTVAITVFMIVSGAAQLVAPDVVLRAVGGDLTPATLHFFSMSGMFTVLFGGMLWQSLHARTMLTIPLFWTALQQLGAAAAVGLGVSRGLMSPLALLVAALELACGIALLWYWSRVRTVRRPL
jgi:Clp amino terminal domain, pathogenicity island component